MSNQSVSPETRQEAQSFRAGRNSVPCTARYTALQRPERPRPLRPRPSLAAAPASPAQAILARPRATPGHWPH
jgi:hypothetical protein